MRFNHLGGKKKKIREIGQRITELIGGGNIKEEETNSIKWYEEDTGKHLSNLSV